MTLRIHIEQSTKPWFGPKSRAKKFLRLRKHVLQAEEALNVMLSLLGKSGSFLQNVRFVDFRNKDEDDFRYTIALVWTKSDARVRQVIYELSETMVKQTGWYPLPQGERIKSQLARKLNWSSLPNPKPPILDANGLIKSLKSAVRTDGGCCVRVKVGDIGILLDSGFPSALEIEPSDRLCLISHTHCDHSGGLEYLMQLEIPVVITKSTGLLLVSQERMRRSDVGRRVFLIDPSDEWLSLGEGLEMLTFLVPHSPGAAGFALRDKDQAIVYTGDIVLQTQRHDFRTRLEKILKSTDRSKNRLLLDATMAGRSFGASLDKTTEALFKEIDSHKDLFIFAQDPEQLLYAYLDIFFYTKEIERWRNKIQFLVTSRLKSVFRVLHDAFIRRSFTELDPFILYQYGSSMSAWAESRWLYWISADDKPPVCEEAEIRIWFVTEEQKKFIHLATNALIAGLGRIRADLIVEKSDGVLSTVDTSAWTLHSGSSELQDFIRSTSKMAKCCLFHNFPNRLRKFVKNNNLESEILTKQDLQTSIGTP